MPKIARRLDRAIAALVVGTAVFGMAVTACSSDAEPVENLSGPGILEAEPTPEGLQSINFQNDLEGTVTSAESLEVGDCFNEYSWHDRAGNEQQAMTVLSCSRPHDAEVFHVDLHPSGTAPFPGDRKLTDFTQDICLELFEPFVKSEYILSDLEIGLFTPTFESWNNRDDRRVTCFVYAFEGGLLKGSMANIGL